MTYFRPHNLDDALSWLADNEALIAAGCTDLFAQTRSQYLGGNTGRKLLDITAIDEISGISKSDEYVRIGAATCWSEIIAADLAPSFEGLKAAAREVGSVQIQNTGTIGGNLCNASPAADSVPALITLDAEVELASPAGRRVLKLQDFLTGAGHTALQKDEILCAVLVPQKSTGGVSNFIKLGARKYLVISIAMVAVRLEVAENKIAQIAISVGSCSAVARRLGNIEQLLKGAPCDINLPKAVGAKDIAASLSPIDDIRADADYRIKAARELVIRAVSQLLDGEKSA